MLLTTTSATPTSSVRPPLSVKSPAAGGGMAGAPRRVPDDHQHALDDDRLEQVEASSVWPLAKEIVRKRPGGPAASMGTQPSTSSTIESGAKTKQPVVPLRMRPGCRRALPGLGAVVVRPPR